MSKFWLRVVVACWLIVTSTSALPLQTASPSSSTQTAKSSAGTPSASEIAAAKASGKVWVNLDSKRYHKGGRWYGKTKNGKFMTADEAKKAGYKLSTR
jgi:hypothetical protein